MSIHYPEGNYYVVVTGQQLGTTKNGNPQFTLSFTPYMSRNMAVSEDDPDAWQPLSVEGYERTMFLVITANTVDFVIAKLHRLGISIPDGDWSKLDQQHPQCASIVERKLVVACTHGEYNNKAREEWDLPYGGGTLEIQPLDAQGVQTLNSNFGQTLAAEMAAQAQATPAPATHSSGQAVPGTPAPPASTPALPGTPAPNPAAAPTPQHAAPPPPPPPGYQAPAAQQPTQTAQAQTTPSPPLPQASPAATQAASQAQQAAGPAQAQQAAAAVDDDLPF